MSDPAVPSPPEAADTPRKARRKAPRGLLLLLPLIVLVGVGLWFAHYEARGKYLQSTNDAEVRADFVTISPRVAGYVSEVDVAQNQSVAAGQRLVRIDSRDYDAQAAQARAQIALAEATVQSARAGLGEQQAQIEQTRAQLAGAKAKAAADAYEVKRYAPLAATNAEPRERLAQLRSTAAQSADNARAEGAALTVQQRHVASLQAQVEQGAAQVASARAKLASVSVDVNATELRAPIAGRVGDKTVTIGQYVQAGTRLMSLAPSNGIYLVANFKETQVGLIRPGQPATIKVDALKGVALHGRVESLSPGTGAQFSLLPPQNATGNFTKIVQRVPVRIALAAGPEARRVLLPGLSATVTVDTISAKGARERLKDEADGKGPVGG